MEARRVELLRLMARNQWSASDVGRMLDRRPQTVRQWRTVGPPDHALALLLFAERTQARN